MDITNDELEKLKLEAESIELQYSLSQTSETVTQVENKTIDVDYEEEIEEEEEEPETTSIIMYDGEEEVILLSELDDYTRLWNDRYCKNDDAQYCDFEDVYEYCDYVSFYKYVDNNLNISEITVSSNFNFSNHIYLEEECDCCIFESQQALDEYLGTNYKIDNFIHKNLIINTVEQFYPEDYQFGTIKDFNFNLSIIDTLNSNGIVYILLLKFDNFEIKNGSHLKHNIKDLFVLIGFNKDNNLIGKLFGIRSSKTKTEHYCDYEHSHLISNNFKLSKFCLGSGQIVDTISKCISDFNELNFSSLLASIRYYIRWESLEGKPYKYIRNIKNKDSVPEIGQYSDILLKLLIVHIDKLKIIKKESSFDIDIDSVNEFLNKMIINIHLKNKTDVTSNHIKSYIVFKEDNDYYTISQINNINNNVNFESIELFTFKNDKVYSKIIDQKENINIDYTKAYINQSLVYETTREFVKRINEYFLSKEV